MVAALLIENIDAGRFWAKVDRRADGECWPWTGARSGSGYGCITAKGRGYSASRVSWFLANGRQPDGEVCHSCDNPPCVNPSHLWVGSHRDNMRDILAKGRRIAASETHCVNGHELTPENTRTNKSGSRACRACNKASVQSYQQRNGRPPRRKETK